MTQREADREKNEERDKSEYKKTKTSQKSLLCLGQDCASLRMIKSTKTVISPASTCSCSNFQLNGNTFAKKSDGLSLVQG